MFKRLIKRLFKRHKWEYRNPCSRQCVRCGRTEDKYDWAWNTYNEETGTWRLSPFGGWWEQMYPLPHTPEACHQANE